MEGKSVRIPEKVFFSNDPREYIVKNDFYFTIYKDSVEKEDKKM